MGGSSMSPRLRLVLFGDGLWAAESLRRLLQGPYTVTGVVVRARPTDGELADAARAARIPVFQPVRVNDSSIMTDLRALAPDLGLSIAYDQIFRPALLELPRLGVLNFHAGMLPFYRGRNVINWALINGEREIGITAHFVDEGIDTGDILRQLRLPIGWNDTYGEVLCRVIQVMPDLVEEVVRLVASGEYARQPQPPVGTYFGARGDGDEWLDWADTSVNLHNKVRAITRPGPGARTLLGAESVTIWRAYCDPTWPKYLATAGQVVGRTPEGVLIKTGDSVLLVKEAQVGNQESQTPSWPIGTRLGPGPNRLTLAPALSSDTRGRAP
jgi:methionyl-tRNA formyltransferase